ncbi:hypothetical protein [Streptomyces sp. NPDC088261]|uniref:hypothetical protein n=1 Tax=Streptomyces sp. NPDC088261 TaxID=3365851 RepID=UPI0037F7154A
MRLTSPDFTDDNDTWHETVSGEEHDPLETARVHMRGLLDHAQKLAGEPGRLIELALSTAQRAFDEIGVCNSVLDEVSDRGEEIAKELEERLGGDGTDAGVVPELFAELEALAARVAASEANRRVVNRILGQDESGNEGPHAHDADVSAEESTSVPRLTSGALPRIPSLYDSEQPGYGTLTDMMEVRDRTAAERAAVHARRTDLISTHIVAAVTRLSDRSFSDEGFARETVAEVRRAYDLWCRCAAERRDDLA